MICLLIFVAVILAIPIYLFSSILLGYVGRLFFEGTFQEKIMKSGILMTFLLVYMTGLCAYLLGINL